MTEPGALQPSAATAAPRFKAAGWATALLLVSWIAWPGYPGTAGPYLLFDAAFVAMLLIALPRPLSYAYLFFAILLFLGFWSKLMAHLIFGTAFVEPVGNFSGSAAQWDTALEVAAMGAVGLIAARLIHLALAARRELEPAPVRPPSWYVEWRRPVWIASLVAMLALHALNFQVAFYQTGVNPRIVLPFHLNVLPGWLVNIGFALWFSVLIHWEFERAPRSLGALLLVPVAEGLTSSVSAMSRSFFLTHSASYFVAAAAQRARLRAVLSRRAIAGLAALWVLGLALSLTAVSWLRIKVYLLTYEPGLVSAPSPQPAAAVPPVSVAPASPPVPGTPPAPAAPVKPLRPPVGDTNLESVIPKMAREVAGLVLQRWIGLEAVLAVSSHPRLGPALFREGVTQNPRTGEDSVYQALARSRYTSSERFTFGTLPGIVGILFYSGSLALVIAGTLFVTLLMMTTELAALRLTGNPFLVTLMALGMAHVATQMNFAYLSAVFIAQLWVAIVFVWLLRAGPRWWQRRRIEADARA